MFDMATGTMFGTRGGHGRQRGDHRGGDRDAWPGRRVTRREVRKFAAAISRSPSDQKGHSVRC